MAEKVFYVSVANASTASIEVGLSGIVKRVWIVTDDVWSLTDGTTPSYGVVITPIIDDYTIGPKMKFYYGEKLIIPADNVSLSQHERAREFNRNFYVDKKDYLVIRNAQGATAAYLIGLDIVPLSDKTRLYLGGEYHNQ